MSVKRKKINVENLKHLFEGHKPKPKIVPSTENRMPKPKSIPIIVTNKKMIDR